MSYNCGSPPVRGEIPSPSGSSNSNTTGQNVRPLSINLKYHCVLCLQPEDQSVIQDILDRNPRAILNFQPLVYYLTGIDPTGEEGGATGNTGKYFPVMTNLPPMCAQCYAILGEIYRLHAELVGIQVRIQKQIALARRIVKSTVKDGGGDGGRKRTGGSVRQQLFRNMGVGMKSKLTTKELDALKYFVDNFHGLIIDAGDKFIYPSPPPPQDPHKSEQTQTPPPAALIRQLSYPVQFAPSGVCESSSSPPQQYSSPSPHAIISPQSPNNANSEMILVSGIDHNIKYEMEDEDGDEDNQGEMETTPIVLIKEDLDEDGNSHQDNQIFYPSTSPHTPPPSNQWQVAVQPCDVCNEMLNISLLPSHLLQHLGRTGWSCDVCSQIFLCRTKLIHHFTDTSSGGTYCAQNSPWYRNLTHICSQCSTNFSTEAALHHHIYSIHELEKSLEEKWICKMCNFKCRTEQALDFHFLSHLHSSRQIHHSSTSSPSSVQQATTSWSSYGVKKRKRKVAPKSLSAEDYTCDICGKKCVGGTALLRHVKEIHKGKGWLNGRQNTEAK